MATIRPVTPRRSARISSLLASILGLALVLGGCATPVGVKHVDIQTAYGIQTESALSEAQPSESSKMVLRRLGLLDRYAAEPAQVLAELHHGLATIDDEDRLFALAELSLLHAERAKDKAYFLASAVYAWALLFPDDGGGTEIPPSDPRYRLTYDLYNQAVAKGLASEHGKGLDQDEVRLTPGPRKLPFGTLDLGLDDTGMTWGGYRLEHFIPTTTLEVRGLRNRYRSPGLGAPLAASLARGPATVKIIGAERLGARMKVPITALLRFDHARAGLARGWIEGRIELYAADQFATVPINGHAEPLESDPTATLGYALEGSPLYASELVGLLKGGVLRALAKGRAQDGLFLFHPFKPGKIPVVLVHGTGSSPARWAELANELEGDPRIRDRFQIWLFTYDTGNPIGMSAGRLRSALAKVVQEFDPKGQDRALRDMVVIGHSQGGLLTKLTAVDSGDKFWTHLSDKPFDSLAVDPKTKEEIRSYAFYTPLPFVSRVIFMATPHHGALLASGRIGAIATWLVTLPVNLFGQIATAVTKSGDEKLIAHLRHPPTAIDNMNPDNLGLKILSSLPIDPRIKANSIISVEGGTAQVPGGDDGVVAYKSAHIEGVESELVVDSDHGVQSNAIAIEEVRRILLEHLANFEGRRP